MKLETIEQFQAKFTEVFGLQTVVKPEDNYPDSCHLGVVTPTGIEIANLTVRKYRGSEGWIFAGLSAFNGKAWDKLNFRD